MNDRFLEYISKFMTLSEEEAQEVSESIETRELKKGSVLLQKGQISRESYFILRGCIRKYKIIDSEEKITNFYTEEEWVTSISYSSKYPSDYYLVCNENCTLIVGNEQGEKDFYKLFQKFPRLEALSRKVMENEVIKYQEMLSSYKTDTAEQRYINLQKNRPELLRRVPLHQIASYIGVKPESLSRIRKRIAKIT